MKKLLLVITLSAFFPALLHGGRVARVLGGEPNGVAGVRLGRFKNGQKEQLRRQALENAQQAKEKNAEERLARKLAKKNR